MESLHAREGDAAAVDGDDAEHQDLASLVYPHLRRICERAMNGERRGHTLSPTALAHEAYLRLADEEPSRWTDEAHFLAAAASEIRRVLIDYARARRADKRGGGLRREDGSLVEVATSGEAVDVVALSDALDELAEAAPRQARLVELRFFAGLTFERAAEAMGISVATAKRDWAFARAWLYRSLAVE